MTDTLDTHKLTIQETVSSGFNPPKKLKTVSIIIPTYRAENYLRPLLDMLNAQQAPGYQFEILLIDSASEDSTREIAERYQKIRFHQIERKNFSHPGTRNLAAAMTESDYVVFMTQDALPRDSYWLRELMRPFEHWPHLAASYSRQIPRQDCNPLEARDVRCGAPAIDELRALDLSHPQQMEEYRNQIPYFIRFSNVSACYRADLLRNFPFNEKLKMVEDQDWSKRLLERGYGIYYAAKSVVIHSHELNSAQIYQRYRDYGASFKQFMPPRKKVYPLTLALWNIVQDTALIAFCRGALLWKVKWMALSWPRRISAYWGFRRGWKRG